MSETSSTFRNFKGLAATTALSVLLIFISFHFLDARLTLFVARRLEAANLSKEAAQIPDILLFFVLFITVLSWAMFFFSKLRPIQGIPRSLFLSLGLTVPFSFLMKAYLKPLFGRPLPSVWLYDHNSFGFHWFHGGSLYDAFPSGHMAVFTALMLCIARYYPDRRIIANGFLAVLGLALVLTNRHFLSDVIAGFLVGLLCEWATDFIVSLWRKSQANHGCSS